MFQNKEFATAEEKISFLTDYISKLKGTCSTKTVSRLF